MYSAALNDFKENNLCSPFSFNIVKPISDETSAQPGGSSPTGQTLTGDSDSTWLEGHTSEIGSTQHSDSDEDSNEFDTDELFNLPAAADHQPPATSSPKQKEFFREDHELGEFLSEEEIAKLDPNTKAVHEIFQMFTPENEIKPPATPQKGLVDDLIAMKSKIFVLTTWQILLNLPI